MGQWRVVRKLRCGGLANLQARGPLNELLTTNLLLRGARVGGDLSRGVIGVALEEELSARSDPVGVCSSQKKGQLGSAKEEEKGGKEVESTYSRQA